jgi:hypothetical protein
MVMNDLVDNISNEHANAIQYILSEWPAANMGQIADYTLTQIVLSMDNLQNVEKVITYFKQGFEENEIISIINESDERIALMYELINQGVERENATALICVPDEHIQIALSFINVHHISNNDLSTILYNQFDNMFPRMDHLIQQGVPVFTAYTMADENNDTEQNIIKLLHFMNNGMNSEDAYDEITNN